MVDYRREPFTFMLVLGMASSVMLFLFIFLTFALKEIKNQEIALVMPVAFYVSTILIMASSVLLYYSDRCLKNEKFKEFRQLLLIGFTLGFAFIIAQLIGWQVLWSEGITMANSTAGSFLFILSGVHLVHVLIGLAAFSKLLADAYLNKSYVDSWVYSVNPKMQLRIKLISWFWHFLGLLWLLVFLFLFYQAHAS